MTARRVLAAAAVLIGIAAFAPNTTHALMWSLLPAAFLVVVGLLDRPAPVAAGAARLAGTATAAALTALVVLAVVGAVVTTTTLLEPAWLDRTTLVVGWATVAAVTWLGAVIAARPGRRGAGMLLVVALPLGLAFDRAIDAVLPVDFFVHGVTISLLLLAVAVLRLATTTERTQHARAQADGAAC